MSVELVTVMVSYKNGVIHSLKLTYLTYEKLLLSIY